MSFSAAIGNAPSLNAFRTESQKNEAVALKKDGLQAQPAKQGFFGRIMQWVRGENPARINSDTKEAFVAALSRKYGSKAADTALAQTSFYRGNDQPLTSREIKLAIGYAKKQAAGPGSGSSAQSLASATKDMLKTRADSVKKGQNVQKLTALVARLRTNNDPQLGAAQNKLAAAKQDLQQTRSQLDVQAKKIAAGELPIVSAGAQPSGSTAARDAQSKQESRPLNNEARIQQKEQNAAMRAENKQHLQELRAENNAARIQQKEQNAAMRAESKQNLQEMRAENKQNLQEMRADNKKMKEEMREQAKLAREQSRAEQQVLRNERSAARQVATQQQQAARAEQRELRAQAKLERSHNAEQRAQKILESAEKLLNQTSRMVENEEAALMAEINKSVDMADAFSAALARPIGGS